MTIQLPAKTAQYFKENPEIFRYVQPYINAGPWEAKADLKQIEIIVDDLTVAVIDKGEQMKAIRSVPETYETYEIAFDREPVFYVVDDYLLLNRVDAQSLIDYINAQP